MKNFMRRLPGVIMSRLLLFVGTSYAPPAAAPQTAKPVAEQYGIGDLVTESTSRIGYLDSLRLMQSADGLILLGSDDLTYSPSKIYPSYMTGRPTLALAHHGSHLSALLGRLQCSRLVTLLEPGRETDPTGELAGFFRGVTESQQAAYGQPQRDTAWFRDHFLAEVGARRQCTLFDAAVARSSRAS